MMKDMGELAHFDHESTLSTSDGILGTDSRVERRDYSPLRFPCWDWSSHLAEDNNQSSLSHDSRFAAHIRTCNEQCETSLWRKAEIIGNKTASFSLVYNWMSARVNF